MDINWSYYITPIVSIILTTLAALLAKVLYRVFQDASAYLKEKLGAHVYNEALSVAKGIYILLEDKYKDSLVKMGEVKKQEMKAMLLERFPNLTEIELDAINKSVWLSFNKSWEEEMQNNKHDNTNSEV